MGALAGKHDRTDNESIGEQQKRTFRSYNARAIRQNKAWSKTKLYNLPLEMLDIILQKTYLHWILYSSTMQRDEDVITSLISVDVCFYRRITRQRFKKAIWRYLKDFYDKNKRSTAISRNNRDYFLKNIQPNAEFLDSLLNFNCITEQQRHFIQRKRSKRHKNDEFLRIVRSCDDRKFSNIATCLRQTNQMEVAMIVEYGGVVIEVKVKNCGTTCIESRDPKLLHQTIEDHRNRTKPRSDYTEKLIRKLKDKDIEILNSQMDRQTVVVWIWCGSQAALEYIQKLYESNQLRDIFEKIQPSTSKLINIDRNQFKKTVVMCSISFNFTFTHRIVAGEREYVRGVTKLRNEIYILCRSYSRDRTVIRVFEDRSSFSLQTQIEIKAIKDLNYIGSSEKENCLYVSDSETNSIWKIIRETGDQHEISKWLTHNFLYVDHWSVSKDGHLLIAGFMWSILSIYGSDAKLIRSIQLPRNIHYPIHAVETSTGNFIISHKLIESESNGRHNYMAMNWGISELSRDGQMVIRHFIPSNGTQQVLSESEGFRNDAYFLLDSDDRVFITDKINDRIILLDSNLKWNRILCKIKVEEEEEQEEKDQKEQEQEQEQEEQQQQQQQRQEQEPTLRFSCSLCYDERKKQLIVGEFYGLNVYT